jgi:excisionase family DNA binding protein
MNIEQCGAEEIAATLGIPLDTLYRHARAGRIRAQKIAGSWRFDMADVQKFVQTSSLPDRPSPSIATDDFKPAVLPDLLRRADSSKRSGVIAGPAHASCADLDRASSLLADSLLSRGVVPGDRVLILLSNSLEFVAACFAAWKAGAVVVAEDPAIKDAALCHIMRDCGPEALITDRATAEKLHLHRHCLDRVRVVYVKGHTFGLSNLEDLRVESLDSTLQNETTPASLRFNSVTADDVATITYASSRVHGVTNSHQNWLAGAAFTCAHHGLTARDSLLLLPPLHHSSALRQLLAQIAAGARIILTPNLAHPVKLLKLQSPTALALGAADMTALPQKFAPALRHLAGNLRYVEFESKPLDQDQAGPLRRLLPRTKFYPAWNLTEAHAAYFAAAPGQPGAGVPKMPPGLEMRIVDEQGRRVPAGHSGWILLAGSSLMTGLWGQSEYAMRSFKQDGYRLGIKASLDQSGAISFAGPTEETLEIRGRKINLTEIESVLRRHIRVIECAVIGVAELTGDVKLHAFVVPTAKGAMLTESELKTYCRTFLEGAKIPARFHFEKSLPKSAEGNILRAPLRAAAALGHSDKRHLKRATIWPAASEDKLLTGL